MAMHPSNSQEMVIPPSLQQWLQQGELLYSTALKDFHELEAQLENLESQIIAKQSEVNQIAQLIGKPPVEGNRRLSAQLVTPRTIDRSRERAETFAPPEGGSARALTGKFARNP